MASFTRKAIMDSFMKLVDQRPISKITIKDIVEDCGINRNTFYYHFADIPALIEAIVRDQAEELIRNHSSITTIEDALNVAVDSILQHRRAALHIFNSVSRDVYERYLMQICQDAVEKCFDAIIGERRVSPQDREILILSYRAWCFGLVIDWLDHGLKDDIHPTLTRMCELHKGMIEEMASRCIIE